MTLAIGFALGLGLLLVASPFFWPATAGGSRQRPGSTILARLRDRMAQAGLATVSVPTFVAVSLILGIALSTLTYAVVSVTALAAIAGLAGLLLPVLAVTGRAARLNRANLAVWPDAVDHLVSAIRAGLSLPDSLSSLAVNGPTTAKNAFAGFEADYRATGNFSGCLDRLKERVSDPIADRIIETLRMSREVGGSELTTVLRNLSAYLRQEAAIRSEIQARQSWVMNAARLGVAAPWIVLVLLATRPEAAAAYNSPPGSAVILAGLGLSVFAYRLMVAMSRLPQEHRWFR
ncbi:MAG: type II secretion system F family protein [Microbacteriaceae bacterium]